MNIRPADRRDAPAMWAILRDVARGGDTIPTDSGASEVDMAAQWFGADVASHVAVDGNLVVGMSKLGANQPDRGSHVATATVLVDPSHRRRGIGAALVEHCIATATAAGFQAMQFNFVVSSNAAALSLYRKLGFEIVGTLPHAFNHRVLGHVDAHVLFRTLEPPRSRVTNEDVSGHADFEPTEFAHA